LAWRWTLLKCKARNTTQFEGCSLQNDVEGAPDPRRISPAEIQRIPDAEGLEFLRPATADAPDVANRGFCEVALSLCRVKTG